MQLHFMFRIFLQRVEGSKKRAVEHDRLRAAFAMLRNPFVRHSSKPCLRDVLKGQALVDADPEGSHIALYA